MKKFLSLSLFVLALLPVNGLLSYAQEVVTPETNLPEGSTTEVPGTEEGNEETVPPTEEGTQEAGEEQAPSTKGDEEGNTPETQTTNTYELVANNFMVNVSELPEVKSCEVIRATSCVGSYQTWPEEMAMYANPTLVEVDANGEIVGLPEDVKYSIMGHSGEIRWVSSEGEFITSEGQYDLTIIAEYLDPNVNTGLPIHVETPIKLTVVSDDVFIDSSHVAGIQTTTKEVVMTPDQVKARMENWKPVTGINSVKYDAEAMVEDLFGAKVIAAGNDIDSQLVMGVKNTEEISGILDGTEGTYNIQVGVGVSEAGNAQEEGTVEGAQTRVVGDFETLTLVITNNVLNTPSNPTSEVQSEAGTGVNTGVNNTTMALLTIATIASVALILNRRK